MVRHLRIARYKANGETNGSQSTKHSYDQARYTVVRSVRVRSNYISDHCLFRAFHLGDCIRSVVCFKISMNTLCTERENDAGPRSG